MLYSRKLVSKNYVFHTHDFKERLASKVFDILDQVNTKKIHNDDYAEIIACLIERALWQSTTFKSMEYYTFYYQTSKLRRYYDPVLLGEILEDVIYELNKEVSAFNPNLRFIHPVYFRINGIESVLLGIHKEDLEEAKDEEDV